MINYAGFAFTARIGWGWKMKEIRGIVQGGTGAEDKMIALAAWIRKNYGSTMIQALKVGWRPG